MTTNGCQSLLMAINDAYLHAYKWQMATNGYSNDE